mmetsp:Transcript_5945/g.24100  ORF Transcript_5945/g.24100 Transcript_5945/m.24100 type:complete len:293 (-) Transcript_5945:1557-2435(-)
MSPPETPTAAACVCVSTEEIRGKPFARFSARAFLRSTMRAARRAALFADLETHADEDEDAPCSSFSALSSPSPSPGTSSRDALLPSAAALLPSAASSLARSFSARAFSSSVLRKNSSFAFKSEQKPPETATTPSNAPSAPRCAVRKLAKAFASKPCTRAWCATTGTSASLKYVRAGSGKSPPLSFCRSVSIIGTDSPLSHSRTSSLVFGVAGNKATLVSAFLCASSSSPTLAATATSYLRMASRQVGVGSFRNTTSASRRTTGVFCCKSSNAACTLRQLSAACKASPRALFE